MLNEKPAIFGEPNEILQRFGQGGDDDIDLFEAALALAALERGGGRMAALHVADYRAFMSDLIKEFRSLARGQDQAADRASALATCLHGLYGFTGDRDSYDSLENANLMAVIERRKGLPVALGLIYIHVARAVGWSAHGLDFPGHFLIRVDGIADRVILDPFHDGTLLNTPDLRQLLKTMSGERAELRPEHYAPMTNRAILLRLQNNLKTRCLKGGDFVGAIAVLERMLLIAPDDVDSWYDLGVLEVHRGRARHGRDALRQCLDCLDRLAAPTPLERELRQRIHVTLRELEPNRE